MFKKYKIQIIITLVVILSTLFISYKYILPSKKPRIEINTLSSIEVFKFNSFTKFSNEKISTITDYNKLLKFETLFNNLDKSDSIKKVELTKDIDLQPFKYCAHIKPNFKYLEKTKQNSMKDASKDSEQATISNYTKDTIGVIEDGQDAPSDNEQNTDGSFILYILIDDLEGNSYISFVGTNLSYILDSSETRILKEIFIDVQQTSLI